MVYDWYIPLMLIFTLAQQLTKLKVMAVWVQWQNKMRCRENEEEKKQNESTAKLVNDGKLNDLGMSNE